jgi:hypothetical protein
MITWSNASATPLSQAECQDFEERSRTPAISAFIGTFKGPRPGLTLTDAGRLSGRTERQAGYGGSGSRENIQGMMGTNP